MKKERVQICDGLAAPRKQMIGIVAVGVLLLLLAPILGTYLASLYLGLTEGMETEKFLCILEGCIHSIQVIGTLIMVYGFFYRKGGEKNI